MLDSATLEEFMSRFFGYGTWDAPLWFIGMEEGGGTSESEISSRLTKWSERGRKELEDLVSYSAELGITQWFGPAARLQPTWRSLARVLLGYEGIDETRKSLIQAQCARLGSEHGGAALLELLPLPSPGIRDWHYGGMTDLSLLHDRATYTTQLLPLRAERLNERIRARQPRVVVCYGLAYRQAWERVAGTPLSGNADDVPMARVGRSLVVVMRHPAARGASSAYFQQVGKTLARMTGA
jgi:hypothetical protein